MRLTLRTLLAYLDDTLGANEIKGIGDKVAESDAAQELIARIKQVTRRRRLTTPPTTGPGAFDPNDVAEYLDNELEGERIADVEKQCLESDVHLAEIAACHQILTLVLGEPALVPPKAKERMYKLVTTRESIPYRKAAPARKANPDGLDDDEELELGGGWLRWVLPAAGILLVAALGVAVFSILQKPGRPGPVASNTGDRDKEKDAARPKDHPDPVPAKDKDGKPVDLKDRGKEPPPPTDGGKSPPAGKDGQPKDGGKPKPPDRDPGVVARTAPPNSRRGEIGSYRGGLNDIPTALAVRKTEGWQALPDGAVVHSSDTLTALPGFTALVDTLGGVGLTMRGHIPPYSISPRMNLLMESSVVLHQSDEFDLDLTLLRGRVYLRNKKPKGPARVRIRFEQEVWDLTLTLPGDEAGLDLFKEYSAPVDHLTEPPHASLVMFMLSGDAQLNVDAFHTHAMEAADGQAMVLLWDGFRKTGTPQRIKMLPEFSKTPPTPEQVEGPQKAELREALAGLKNLQTLIGGKRDKPAVALKETLADEKASARILAIYCLAALDDPEKLVDVLGDEQQEHAVDRLVAIYALRHWLAANQDQYKRLFDREKEAGILIDRKYKVSEAKMLTDLLFDFSPEFFSRVETFEELKKCLPHRRIAISELGMWHLARLALGIKLPPGFNAAKPVEERERYADKINEMISKRLLPPAPMSLPPKE